MLLVPSRKVESRGARRPVSSTLRLSTLRPSTQSHTLTFSNGFTLTGLTTSPLRIAEADTHTFFTSPSTTHLTFWRFGLNFRRLVPRIFLPTPPRYFALPRYFLRFP